MTSAPYSHIVRSTNGHAVARERMRAALRDRAAHVDSVVFSVAVGGQNQSNEASIGRARRRGRSHATPGITAPTIAQQPCAA